MMERGEGRLKFTNLAKVLLLRLYVPHLSRPFLRLELPAISIAKCRGRLGDELIAVIERPW